MKKLLSFCLALMPLVATAQSLLIEDFNYQPNTRLSANGWAAHSGVGTNSPTTSEVSFDYYNNPSPGGYAVGMTTSGEDVNRSFGANTSGTIYASFQVNVKAAQATGDYFFHFGPAVIDTVFRARVFVKSAATNKFQFGIAKARTANYTTESFDIGKTYTVVVRYVIVAGTNNDVVELFVNPTSATLPTTGWLRGVDGENDIRDNVGSLALRQGSTANAATLSIDRIRVATDWPTVVSAYDNAKSILVQNTGAVGATDLDRLQKIRANVGVTSTGSNFFVSAKTTAAMTATASTNFEVGYNNVFGQTATIPAGTYTQLQMTVRPKTTAFGVFAGTITFTSSGLQPLVVAVGATVLDANQQQLTIAQARNQAIGANVEVNGTVTAQFGPTLYVQDASGGIPIYLGTTYQNYAIGDSLTVGGPIQTFNSQIQIGGGAIAANVPKPLGKAKQTVTPKVIKITELSANEGRLVQIAGATFDNLKGLFYADVNWGISTADGKGEVRISRFSELPNYHKPQTASTLAGVVGRFKNTTSDIYQLFPRQRADVSGIGAAYSVSGGNVARNTTLDVAAWNVTWFGSTSNGPTNEALQLTNVKRVLDSLSADVYILSEVANSAGFTALVGQMSGFSGSCSPRMSAGASDANGQRTCFLYKTDVFKNPTFKNLLTGTNTANLANYPVSGDRFWASGRLPYMMTADVVINNVTQKIHFVSIHARANSSTDAENLYLQRKYDIKVLKDTLDAQYGNVPLIMAGDFNDDVDETVASITSTKESSYKSIIDDATKYRAVTQSLSTKGYRSYMTFENMIDHVVITDEFFTNMVTGSEGHETAFRYIPEYASTTSDHLPVFARFKLTEPITGIEKPTEGGIIVYPNPVENNVFEVKIAEKVSANDFTLFNTIGKKIDINTQAISAQIYRITPKQKLNSGVYLLKAGASFRKILVR